MLFANHFWYFEHFSTTFLVDMSQPNATAELKKMKEYTERIEQFSARTHDYLASGRKAVLSREHFPILCAYCGDGLRESAR